MKHARITGTKPWRGFQFPLGLVLEVLEDHSMRDPEHACIVARGPHGGEMLLWPGEYEVLTIQEQEPCSSASTETSKPSPSESASLQPAF